MKWIIYELRIWNQVKLWSTQLWAQFLQLRREVWKIQDFNGVWTRDLAIPVRRSNQLSYEANDVGNWSFVGSNGPVRNESMMKWYIWNESYMNCRFHICSSYISPEFFRLLYAIAKIELITAKTIASLDFITTTSNVCAKINEVNLKLEVTYHCSWLSSRSLTSNWTNDTLCLMKSECEKKITRLCKWNGLAQMDIFCTIFERSRITLSYWYSSYSEILSSCNQVSLPFIDVHKCVQWKRESKVAKKNLARVRWFSSNLKSMEMIYLPFFLRIPPAQVVRHLLFDPRKNQKFTPSVS